ncbi:16S rRNA (uracil(1498)-N(3))-methyltransferase [Herbiconiux sp. L3-i23]|uniref:16S rRNA (uracil(1498)-N(3))-methyltransferase n=1 Tax=Herbiconiux sp. L3-i23 TaxID=2905871 RepID=UPI00204CCAC5|nr:16S rRNA (uracil(1498)-N(3))-methyltransferase [Herbiconiux sp. L3-i23]BDI23072.1 ribosomal RNA small subunit methyltransferase E [Herbiconiux sp. L3-i23]
MAHFYLTDADLPGARGVVELTGTEAKHAATVSRVRVGEQLLVGDGAGGVADCVVVSAAATLVELQVRSVSRTAAPARTITLVQALAKGDRDELAVQASTELGVDRVVPWLAERSVSRWEGAKVVKGVERWRAIVREAVKQSLRPWLPEVSGLATTSDVAALARSGRLLVLHPGAESSLADAAAGDGDLVLVVGPEGGVSPAELARLRDAGAVGVRLGSEVLRTSTAGPAAIAALSSLTGRWR